MPAPTPPAGKTSGDIALLLTATIAPSRDIPGHTHFDPAARLREYEAGVVHYLTAPGPDWTILFCDNSGHPLDSLRALAARHARPGRAIHFHGYRGEVPPERRKGIAEFELIDTAMRAFAGHVGPTTEIWKVTGRLQVDNMGEMVASAGTPFDVYADVRDVPLIGDRLGGNQWVDTRLFGFSPEGHRRFIRDRWKGDWMNVEKHLYRVLMPELGSDARIIPRFRVQPDIRGVCGGSGSDYDSASYRAKFALRRAARRIAPGLWL
jgi:hypothetical protein